MNDDCRKCCDMVKAADQCPHSTAPQNESTGVPKWLAEKERDAALRERDEYVNIASQNAVARDRAVAEREAARVERDRLQQWKNEALPVIAGLQELGRALGVGLGEQITGAKAVAAAKTLVEDRDAYLHSMVKVIEERNRALEVAAFLTKQRDSLLEGTKPAKSIEATLRAKCGDVLDEVQMFAVVEALTGATSLADVIDPRVECPADPPNRHPKCPQSEYLCGHHSQHTWGTPTDTRCTFCGGDS